MTRSEGWSLKPSLLDLWRLIMRWQSWSVFNFASMDGIEETRLGSDSLGLRSNCIIKLMQANKFDWSASLQWRAPWILTTNADNWFSTIEVIADLPISEEVANSQRVGEEATLSKRDFFEELSRIQSDDGGAWQMLEIKDWSHSVCPRRT